MKKAAPKLRSLAPTTVVCADAQSWRFPRENLVVFIYVPFGFDTLDPAMQNLREEELTAGRSRGRCRRSEAKEGLKD